MRSRMAGEANGSAVMRSLVMAGAALVGAGDLGAQSTINKVPDAQVEANVLKALASAPALAEQHISTSSVYGVVTLSGQVKDEASRTQAEDVVSRTAGVQKVVDELTIGEQTQAIADTAPQPAADPEAATEQGSNPQLQSDGTMAPPAANQGAPGIPPAQGQVQNPPIGAGPTAQPETGAPVQRSPEDQAGSANGQPQYGEGAGQPPYGQPGQPGYGQGSQSPYGQAGQPPYGQAGQPPYGPPNQGQYPQGQYGQGQGQYGPGYPPPYSSRERAYAGQAAGQPVSIPAGATVQIRMNQGLDSKHVQPGTTFTGTVARDVVAGGFVAIPRGAQVQGTVVDTSQGGALKGRSTLSLQLNQLTLGGQSYTLMSNVWTADGHGNTGRTVNSAVGLGALGAIIGGVAGGGAGAAIGAGAGAVTGVGVSAAQGSSPAFLPPEAVIQFQLTSPTLLTTVSQSEMQRLGYGVPNGAPPPVMVRRRFYPPAPYYYGPGYYYAPRVYYRYPY